MWSVSVSRCCVFVLKEKVRLPKLQVKSLDLQEISPGKDCSGNIRKTDKASAIYRV